MNKSKKNKIIFLLISTMFLSCINGGIINAKEPIMEYKYTVEEQKVKRAQFIWTSSIESLRKDKIINDEEAKNINKYLKEEMKIELNKGRLKRFEHEKKALRVSTVDKMVNDSIISSEQGCLLKKKLNKYDISNLEN